jgi:septal ring-binding cell division protein DamX
MFSFVPPVVKRYRRNNPYTHPFLFFVVDCTDSCLQFALLGALAYGGYKSFNHWNTQSGLSKAPTLVAATPVETAIVPASSKATSAEPKVLEIKTLPVEPLVRDEPTLVLDGRYALRWVQSQPADDYTIQFGASVNKSELIDFANEHLTNGAVIYPFKRTEGNQVMYGVASGLYDSMSSALVAIDNMPVTAVVNDPWIRPIKKLQRQVSRTSATTR